MRTCKEHGRGAHENGCEWWELFLRDPSFERKHAF